MHVTAQDFTGDSQALNTTAQLTLTAFFIELLSLFADQNATILGFGLGLPSVCGYHLGISHRSDHIIHESQF
jgi:hypothetical protein